MNTRPFLPLTFLFAVACSEKSSGTGAGVDGGGGSATTGPEDGGETNPSGGNGSGSNAGSGPTGSVDGGDPASGGSGGGPSNGGNGGPCGDTSSVAAFFESNSGTLPVTVADSGGGIATQFTGTYNLFIDGPGGMSEGSVIVEQLTPTHAVPYGGYIFSYMEPPDSFQDAANEVNVMLEGHIGLHALIQCDKATGVISFGATNRMDGMSFVRLETAP